MTDSKITIPELDQMGKAHLQAFGETDIPLAVEGGVYAPSIKLTTGLLDPTDEGVHMDEAEVRETVAEIPDIDFTLGRLEYAVAMMHGVARLAEKHTDGEPLGNGRTLIGTILTRAMPPAAP